MSVKTFCDICGKEIKNRDEEIKMWSSPMNSYCIGCWIDKKNWSKIHKVPEKKIKKYLESHGK